MFLDGPKGPSAVELAKRGLEHQSVKFVGIHDMHRLSKGLPNKSRRVMESADGILFTDEQWFVEGYGELDTEENRHADDGQNGMRWQPYW